MKLIFMIAFGYILIEYLNYLNRKEQKNHDQSIEVKDSNNDNAKNIDKPAEELNVLSDLMEKQSSNQLSSKPIADETSFSENLRENIDILSNLNEVSHIESNKKQDALPDSTITTYESKQEFFAEALESQYFQQESIGEIQPTEESNANLVDDSELGDIHCYIDENEVPLEECDLEHKGSPI